MSFILFLACIIYTFSFYIEKKFVKNWERFERTNIFNILKKMLLSPIDDLSMVQSLYDYMVYICSIDFALRNVYPKKTHAIPQ